MNALGKQFGRVAIGAAIRCRAGALPKVAWAQEITHETSSPSSRSKSCPMHAFVGLADAGLIRGVSSRNAAQHSVNAEYAVAAVDFLRACPELADAEHDLWQEIHRDRPRVIAHNGQLDVVLALWLNGDLV